jgi:hypothetical protein
MHFFYLDESGDTGTNLGDVNQPIFVLAGISIADEKWNNTQSEIVKIYEEYFNGDVPDNFELHSSELLCTSGEGFFEGHDINKRLGLVDSILALLEVRGHDVHCFAIEKKVLLTAACEYPAPYDYKTPYYCAFDYLITYVNWHMQSNLGRTSRGMIVLDQKDELQEGIEAIIHSRRFEGAQRHRIKRIVEFSYPVDSQKNPMIQFSDLIALCIRRFLEIEKGCHNEWPDEIKNKYAFWYSLIDARIRRKGVVERNGRNAAQINEFVNNIQCIPRRTWRRNYTI